MLELCLLERERERERETDTEREEKRERERETERETDRERDCKRERGKRKNHICRVARRHAQVTATKALNFACKGLYSEGIWIPRERASGYGNALLVHLSHYEQLAYNAFKAKKTLWPFIPKHHQVHHTALDLVWGARDHEWVLNPLAFNCQMMEDFVGKPARLSRRVDVRQQHKNTVDRVLAAVENAFHELQKQ
jgi:hypothetical protein